MTNTRSENFLPSTWEGWDAWHFLREHGYTKGEISALLKELAEVIDGSYEVLPELGISVSIFPGEDDHKSPASRDITSYVLDHLIPRLGEYRPLADLIAALVFLDFIALLLLHADRIADTTAIDRAHDVLNRNGKPYAEQVNTWLRQRRAGYESGKSRKETNAERNRDIRAEAESFRKDGKPAHEIASVLAQRSGLSSRQIRRILNKQT